MKIQINGKKVSVQLELAENATVLDLQRAFHKKYQKYPVERQRFTLDGKDVGGKKVVLQDGSKRLSDYDVHDGASLTFKDLGPQISYQLVFLIEYLGPILIHPLFYYGSKLIYGTEVVHTQAQTISFYMVLVHYLKRELETVFVHRFSHGTMPLTNLFKNSSHYWILGGLLLAYNVYAPSNTGISDSRAIVAATAVWTFSELSNLYVHIALRNLRPAGSKERKIPFGFGFDLISCPNYTFEILAWIAYSFITQSWASWLFAIVGAGQMAIWAEKKHREYRQDFSTYPRGRKILIPFIW